MEVASKEPTELRAGDTLKFKKSLPDFDPSTDTLTYSLSNEHQQHSIVATDNGDGSFLVYANSAATAIYQAGTYRLTGFVTVGADRYTVATSTIEIKPNLANGAVDDRSHVKKTLDALEAVILNKASKDQLSYSIAGRSLSMMSPDEIIRWRKLYKDEYASEQAKEKAKLGRATGRKIKQRFK